MGGIRIRSGIGKGERESPGAGRGFG